MVAFRPRERLLTRGQPGLGRKSLQPVPGYATLKLKGNVSLQNPYHRCPLNLGSPAAMTIAYPSPTARPAITGTGLVPLHRLAGYFPHYGRVSPVSTLGHRQSVLVTV
jgi:hypothetical protein